MIASTLAFDFNRKEAQYFVPRMPMCASTPLWPQYLSREEGDFDAHDIVAFLSAKAPDLLTFGSSYLRCVRQDA